MTAPGVVDRRTAAAEFTRALMSEPTAVVAALMDRADIDATYRRELISGLALGYLSELMLRHRPIGARERLDSTLWGRGG